jgi:hypothetical protein
MALAPLAPIITQRELGGPRLPTGAVEPVRSQVVTEPFLAPAWLEGEHVVARVYDDALGALAAEDALRFHPSSSPSDVIPVQASSGPFPVWDRSTSRVELPLGPGRRLPSGTVGWVEGPPRTRTLRLVSLSALLEGPEGTYVLVRSPGGEFEPRPVRIGRTLDGTAAVMSGLEDGERILVRSAFFVDAERRLAAGAGTEVR